MDGDEQVCLDAVRGTEIISYKSIHVIRRTLDFEPIPEPSQAFATLGHGRSPQLLAAWLGLRFCL